MGTDQAAMESEERFAAYVEQLASVMGHADRKRPLNDYCTGLVMPLERKSVEPLAALTEPGHASAQHQSLLHFVGAAPWSDEEVQAKVRELVLPSMERQEPIAAWIIDDTAIPKKGKHSVGVAHQYCGQLGKQANCQAAVSLSMANHHASLPLAWRLYLPREWTKDRARCKQAGVPKGVRFKTKPQIALDQIHAACRAGTPKGPVLMDAGFGKDTGLRTHLTELGLLYCAGILPQTKVWMAGRRKPLSAEKLALSLPVEAWREVQYGAHPARTQEWLEATMARLFAGEVEGVIWDLQRMRSTSPAAAAEIDNLIGYLQNNRDRIHYRSQRQAGYPLGSGGIESAHKFICHARLKRSGAWWYVANSNHMLALRCAKYNGTFERVFARYQQNILEQTQQKNVKK